MKLNRKLKLILLIFLCLTTNSNAFTPAVKTSINSALQEFLVGDWCLNKEEYQSDISYSGDIWSFYDDGNYEINSNETPYKIIKGSIKMENFGTLKVLKITENEMVAKVYSTYYFSKPRCSEETLHALKVTRLNNAILRNNIEAVQGFIDDGVDVSKADLRSGLQSTPLMLAAKNNNKEMVRLILKQKPDLNMSNYLDKTILDLIKKETIKEEIREMIKHAAKQ